MDSQKSENRGAILPPCSGERPNGRKNGKTHLYWSVAENRRRDNGRVIQRHVLYLGEINFSQAEAWRRAIEVFEEDEARWRALALFPEDRCEAPEGDDVIPGASDPGATGCGPWIPSSPRNLIRGSPAMMAREADSPLRSC